MHNTTWRKTIAVGTMALAIGGLQQASALPSPSNNNWQVVGTTIYGGQIIVGDSPFNNIGQLGTFTSPTATSLNGGDMVTINQYTTVITTGDFGAAIQFDGSNNTLVNNGTIVGPSFDDGVEFSNTGVGFFSFNAMSNINVTNNSFIFGGDGDASNEIGNDAGVSIVSLDGITGVTFVNTGYITGGGNGFGDGALTLSNGVEIFDFNEELDINNVNFLNAGTIVGGANSSFALGVGNGVAIASFGNVNNVTINNTVSGVIRGGDNNTDGFAVGNGVVVMANPEENGGAALFNTLVVNAGQIYGGNNAQILDTGEFVGAPGFLIGNGVALFGGNGVYNAYIQNSGIIAGGNNAVENLEEQSCSAGAAAGSAIAIFDANDDLFRPGDINNVIIGNSGQIIGGSGNGDALIDGAGIGIVGLGNVTNVTITNGVTGTITGGDDNFGIDNFPGGAVIGTGIGVVGDAAFNHGFFVVNTTINNAGTIRGGNDNFAGDIVGSGIGVYGGDGVYNTVLNNAQTGQITGGNSNGEGAIVGTGFGIFDDNSSGLTDIDGVTVNNAGLIAGGDSNRFGSIVGNGIGIAGDGNISNVSIVNASTGVIRGGNFSQVDGPMGGNAIAIETENNSNGFGVIHNVFLNNEGTLLGGSSNEFSDLVGNGFAIFSENGIYNVGIVNSGAIFGGSNNFDATAMGNGIAMLDSNNVEDINSVVILNSGLIYGGNNNFSGELAGNGIGIIGEFNMSNILIDNSGQIVGGDNTGAEFNGEGITLCSIAGSLNNVLIFNSGLIKGGSGGVDNTNAADGIDILAFGDTEGVVNLTNVAIFNTGSIIGGNGTAVPEQEGNSGYGGDAIDIYSDGFMANVSIVNGFGALIKGGDGGPSVGGNNGGDGGDGIFIEANVGSSNLSVTNYGLIAGGNAGTNGRAGIGIESLADNLTINNWGTIQAGAGRSDTVVPGFPAAAISLNGNNNVVNLNGHSSVYGTIEGQGSNNVLNLNFTGVSLLEKQNLLAQLVAQGYPANNFTGAFTFRGVTYYVDPVVLNVNTISYQQQGITPNQQSVGANLDSFQINPTGQMLAMLNAIDQSGAVPVALEALSPQRYQVYGDLAQAAFNFQTLEIDHRLNNLRDGSESIDTIGMGGDTDKTSAGFSKDGKDNKHVAVPEKAPEKRWGFFAAGQGLFGSIDGHGGDLSDANFTSAGLLMGVDGKINDNWVAGLLFDYSHTDVDLDNQGSTANVESFGGGLYSGYHNGGWYANGLGSYTHNAYDSSRVVAFPGFAQTAHAGTSGNQYGLDLDGGYDFKISDHLTVGPLLGLEYVHLDVKGFNEWGAGPADLALGAQGMDSLRSRLGFRADYHTVCRNGVAWAVEGRAAWQHEYLDDSRSISSQFIGSGLGAFNVQTTKPQRDAALLGVGVNATIHDRWTVFVDYDVQAGQDSYLEQSVKGGLKVSF